MDDNDKKFLIEKAIQMAAHNYDLALGVVFNFKRGSNYTSARFAATLESLGIQHSIGRTGISLLTG